MAGRKADGPQHEGAPGRRSRADRAALRRRRQVHLPGQELVRAGSEQPWKQTICVRGHIHLDDPDEGRVYDNRYVIWGHFRWGKMREYEVYEDTEETARLDEYLARREAS